MRSVFRILSLALPALCMIVHGPYSYAQTTGDQPAATQPAKPKRGKPDSPTVDPALLAGPKVEEDAELRDGPRLRPNDMPRNSDDSLPFGAWVSALRGLNLSPQQGASIRQIAREFEDKARAFRDSQPEDVKRLMREVRQAREQGLPPPPESREKLARIEGSMPRPQPYQERIWALLTKEQQEQMKARLDDMRSEMNRQRNSPNMVMNPPDGSEATPATQPDRRPRAIRKGWRSWLLEPSPDDSRPAPASTQPSEPVMSDRP